jgi:hypothetical protein
MGTHLAHHARPDLPGRGFVALAAAVPDERYRSGVAYAAAVAFLALLATAVVVHLFWGRVAGQEDPGDEDAEAAPPPDPPRVVVSGCGRATSRTATSSKVTIAPSERAPVVVLSYEPALGSVQWFASIR